MAGRRKRVSALGLTMVCGIGGILVSYAVPYHIAIFILFFTLGFVLLMLGYIGIQRWRRG